VTTRAPTPWRIAIMAAFALSCFGLLLFLWISFGGTTPFKAKGYRFTAAFPEATTLAEQADIRMGGVTIGHVRKKELDKKDTRTMVTIELDKRFAPIPVDTRAILRQKTLLGETYVELTPGHRSAGLLKDGGRLRNSRIAQTVQIDEIFSSFDEPTRAAFRTWMATLADTLANRGADVNDALGNLAPFADDGARLFTTLDEQKAALARLIKNTSVVAGALTERQGALQRLVVNSDHLFSATASRDRELAETFRIFPTFLDESRLTLARLQRFAVNTRPLVNALKGPATDLGPTLQDLSGLSPDLKALFTDLDPLITASRRGLPALTSTTRGLGPLLDEFRPFLNQLNPILSYLSFNQEVVAGFISNAGANLRNETNGFHQQTQIGLIDGRTLKRFDSRPPTSRGNAYVQPNAYHRYPPLGAIESFDCKPSGGEVRDPVVAANPSEEGAPPCFVQPPSLYNGKHFVRPAVGKIGNFKRPTGEQGTRPARP
jgi:phospholipid/cholesterol/gamma-HCH transport system substrate-binding protein